MNRAFKKLLLWLLMAALPLQGVASAMQVTCGPAHHAGGQIIDPAGGHYCDSASAHAAGDSVSLNASANADKLPSAQNSHELSLCSVCAACCFGASAPPAVSSPVLVDGSLKVVARSRPPLVTNYIPAGLERPPKADHA